MTDYALARKTMVDNQLRTSGITDRRLLVAMGEVPRERFVPAARESRNEGSAPQAIVRYSAGCRAALRAGFGAPMRSLRTGALPR